MWGRKDCILRKEQERKRENKKNQKKKKQNKISKNAYWHEDRIDFLNNKMLYQNKSGKSNEKFIHPSLSDDDEVELIVWIDVREI